MNKKFIYQKNMKSFVLIFLTPFILYGFLTGTGVISSSGFFIVQSLIIIGAFSMGMVYVREIYIIDGEMVIRTAVGKNKLLISEIKDIHIGHITKGSFKPHEKSILIDLVDEEQCKIPLLFINQKSTKQILVFLENLTGIKIRVYN